ncbi:MAG: DDE-type integrase/transposase/recombinase [Flavobacteriales bacterium]|nr:DDE-type integrase/transposase/recombinase [Flavobacteriales bacterium]
MRNEFIYLFAIIDVYSRCISGSSRANSKEADSLVNALKEAIGRFGKHEIINSDQGRQFTSDQYVSYLRGLETVCISMDGKSRATDNEHIERFFCTFNFEKLYHLVPFDRLELCSCRQGFYRLLQSSKNRSNDWRVAPMKR